MKKNDNLFVSAVIAAAGRGSRMNMDISKQYVEILDKPLIAWTLEIFEECSLIDDIVLVVNENDIIYCKRNIIDFFGFYKVRALVSGGSERQKSVYNGLAEVDGRCDIVVIHDGARPFTREDSIADSIHAACEYGAACVAVPAKETIKESDAEGFVRETLERNSLWHIQTPQTFRYGLILDAHKKAIEDGFTGTDDAVLVERLGMQVKLVTGSYDNIKVTTREDLLMAETIARKLSDGDL